MIKLTLMVTLAAFAISAASATLFAQTSRSRGGTWQNSRGNSGSWSRDVARGNGTGQIDSVITGENGRGRQSSKSWSRDGDTVNGSKTVTGPYGRTRTRSGSATVNR